MYTATTGKYTLNVVEDSEPMNPRVDADTLGTMVCWHRRYNLGDKHEFSAPSDFLISLCKVYVEPESIINYMLDYNSEFARLTHNDNHEWELQERLERHGNWYTTDCVNESELYTDGVFLDAVLNAVEVSTLFDIVTKSGRVVILPLFLYDHSGITMSTTSFQCRFDSGQVGYIYAGQDAIIKEFGKCTTKTVEAAKIVIIKEVRMYDHYIQNECYGFRLYKDGEEIDSCYGFLGDIDDIRDEIRSYLPSECKSLVDGLEYVGGNFV